MKIKFYLGLKYVDRVNYIKLAIHKINLARENFMIDLENMDEVFIPEEMSQEQYPMSFQFYDCVFHYAQENLSIHKRDQIRFQSNFKQKHQNNSIANELLKRLFGSSSKAQALSVRHNSIVATTENQINHDQSKHAGEL